MTKEEVIESMIENRKKGLSTLTWSYCLNMNCDDCPFHEGKPICSETMTLMLVDRLIKAEESQKAETNLEHYFNVGDVIVYLGQQIIHLNDNCWDAYENSKSSHIVEWLLSPYEEPKPKFKLTQFEYDLLNVQATHWYSLNSLSFLERLIAKGYFKGIPTDISIKDILANCEVVEE